MSLCFVISDSLPFQNAGKGISTTSGTFLRPMTIDLRLVDTIFTKSLILSLASVVDNVLWSYVYIVQNVQIICKDSYPQYYLCVE